MNTYNLQEATKDEMIKINGGAPDPASALGAAAFGQLIKSSAEGLWGIIKKIPVPRFH